MTISRRDIISGSVTGAGAIALYIYSSGFPVREGQSPAISPGFYPRILAALLGLLAIIQVVSALVAVWKNRRAQKQTPETAITSVTEPIWKDRKALILFLITVGSLVVYPYLMQFVGFSVAGLAFLGVLIFALSGSGHTRREILIMIIITIGIALLTVVVFRTFLKIPFPRGIIFQR